MTLALEHPAQTRRTDRSESEDVQHIVLEDVSWSFYERLLREVGDRHLRITYDEGRLEIVSPISLEHELWKGRIRRLVEMTAFAMRIRFLAAGSTTLKRKDRRKGLEPDECYFLQGAERMRGK